MECSTNDELDKKVDYKDKRLGKVSINVCKENSLNERQIVHSILESIMSLKTFEKQIKAG